MRLTILPQVNHHHIIHLFDDRSYAIMVLPQILSIPPTPTIMSAFSKPFTYLVSLLNGESRIINIGTKTRGFDMIIRVVTYHALQGKDVEKWMETSASELRGVAGMHRVEFFRDHSNPSQYGAIMLFRNKADLDNYKEGQTGPYQSLVRSVRETWCDNSKPVIEKIYEILDI